MWSGKLLILRYGNNYNFINISFLVLGMAADNWICMQAWEKGGKTGDRLVDLVNGERIKAPHHVESGDYLVISLPDVRVMDVTKNK
tara:strand:+ start:5285 stop:5542 length:258 start_codon:yes stop_codon:yes gene_type:complete